jgi:uncharacterized protein
MDWKLEQHHKTALLKLARDSIAANFSEMPEASQNEALKKFESSYLSANPNLGLKLPCFVSLHWREDRELRGCIGTLFTDQALYENVAEYAQHAAFGDPRFPSLEPEELSSLQIGISVLGPEMPLKNITDIEIGKHGLVVRHLHRHGVLLAKVAVEQKWDAEEFLRQTCFKAGLSPILIDDYKKSYFEEISFEE